MKIEASVIRQAAFNYYGAPCHDEMLLRRLGVTYKQIRKYKQRGKVGLSTIAAAKIRLLSRAQVDPMVLPTMFKAIEAKYKK